MYRTLLFAGSLNTYVWWLMISIKSNGKSKEFVFFCLIVASFVEHDVDLSLFTCALLFLVVRVNVTSHIDVLWNVFYLKIGPYLRYTWKYRKWFVSFCFAFYFHFRNDFIVFKCFFLCSFIVVRIGENSHVSTIAIYNNERKKKSKLISQSAFPHLFGHMTYM